MMEPNDIGRLARHVQTICNKYKDEWAKEVNPHEREGVLGENLLDPWEQELKTLVDEDVHIMNYDELDEYVLEFLIEYYAS